MAYLALARKWRPKVFSEVVGQSHVVQALSNALDSGRVHHAFLFTGTRGVGKTTLARIFSKSLNCEEGTSAEPCQKCNTCTAIDEGRYVDLIEIDAASRTKVDDTREILDGVQYAPTVGKYKVYLIDEVHMLSGHSFNALLKTLEEPPEHVKFLFATTDPQKLPITVLSRCLQFNLRAMRPEQVENQLVKILSSENIVFDQPALYAISKAADGSMRDGLSLLDQAIAQGGGTVRTDDVHSMLGTIKAEHTDTILQALADHDVDKVMRVIEDMADNAVDFSAAIDNVLMQLYYVSLAQLAPSSLNVADVNVDLINNVASKLHQEAVQLFYQIGLIAKRDIPLAPSLRVGFEMALLRMLAFDPVDTKPVGAPSLGPIGQPEGQLTDQSAPTESDGSRDRCEHEQAVDVSGADEENALRVVQSDKLVESNSLEKTKTYNNHSDVVSHDGLSELNDPSIYSESTPSGVDGALSAEGSLPAEGSLSQVVEGYLPVEGSPTVEDSPPFDVAEQGYVSSGVVESSISVGGDNQIPSPESAQVQEAQVVERAQQSVTQVTDTQPLVDEQVSAEKEAKQPSAIAVTLNGNNEWGELVEQTGLQGLPKELALNCACEKLSDEKIVLSLSPNAQHLFKDERVSAIQEEVQKVMNRQVDITLDIEESDRETPAECLARLGFEQFEQTKENLHNDPGVQALMSEFGAKINEQSIRTIDPISEV